MRFADGSEAELEQVYPSAAVRRDAEQALTDALRLLPGDPVPRPALKFFLSYSPGVVGGFHKPGSPTLWVGLAQIGSGCASPTGPAEVGRVVRHELCHEWLDSHKLRPHSASEEESACRAFEMLDTLPLRMMQVGAAIAERLSQLKVREP